MSVVDFVCAGCSRAIPRDQFEGEYEWWSACVDHYKEVHPDDVARAEEPSRGDPRE